MHVKLQPILGLLLSLLTGLFVVVYMAPANADENWGVNGRIRLVERIEDKPTGTEDTLRGQFRLNSWVTLGGAKGCLKARVRITSGDAFNSEWIQTGVGKGEADIQIVVRHLYLDTNCIKENIRFEAGAIPARPEGGPGNLGLTDYGWIDGLRVTISDKDKSRDIYLSVGEVSDTKNPNFLTRKHTGINHAMIEIKQGLSKELTAHGSVAAQDKQIFSRAGLNWVVTKYLNWLKTIGLEELNTSIGFEALAADSHIIGGMIYSDFNLKDWKLRTFVTRITPKPTEEEKLGLLFKNFYGYGSNAYFELSRDILNKRVNLSLRARVGDAGKLVEAGVTVPFKK